MDSMSGYFIEPTVLTDLRDDMEISQNEVNPLFMLWFKVLLQGIDFITVFLYQVI